MRRMLSTRSSRWILSLSAGSISIAASTSPLSSGWAWVGSSSSMNVESLVSMPFAFSSWVTTRRVPLWRVPTMILRLEVAQRFDRQVAACEHPQRLVEHASD